MVKESQLLNVCHVSWVLDGFNKLIFFLDEYFNPLGSQLLGTDPMSWKCNAPPSLDKVLVQYMFLYFGFLMAIVSPVTGLRIKGMVYDVV